MANYKSIDEYVSAFPDDVQAKLSALRDLISECAPVDLVARIVKFRVEENLAKRKK